MAWEWDAPTGVYKNHTLSMKMRESALANAVCFQFLTPEPGYGRKKGDTVTVPRIHQLPLAGRVSEQDDLPSGVPLRDTVSKTVSEWGYAVPLTAKEEELDEFNLRSRVQRALRNQIMLTMDVMAATVFKETVITATSTSATACQFKTDGTFYANATNNLAIAHLRLIHDYLSGELKCEKFPDGNYVGILPTVCARGIKNDDDYKEWQAPTTKEPFITGQLPKVVEGFRLIETNHFDALDNSAGSVTLTGEAIFFGADATFMPVVADPELRAGPKRDLGRFQDVGWVGILDAGLTWPEAANSKVVQWGST